MADDAYEVDGRRIDVSNVDKVLFPDDGITKGQLVDHYAELAPRILTAVGGRPLSLVRYPDGLDGEHWFQKQASDHFPDWITRASVTREEDQGTVDHVVADAPATLAYLAGQAAVELHVALASADDLDHPRELVFDLDPPPGADDATVRRATRRVRDLVEELGLPSLLKTSGSRGFHVHVPLDGSVTQDTAHDVARDVATLLVDRYPDELTVAHRKNDRGDRVFVDWLRNSRGQTVVVPYGVRARPGAPVAAPLDWDELSDGIGPTRWTVGNIRRRLAQRADPWASPPAGSDLAEARRRLRAASDR